MDRGVSQRKYSTPRVVQVSAVVHELE